MVSTIILSVLSEKLISYKLKRTYMAHIQKAIIDKLEDFGVKN